MCLSKFLMARATKMLRGFHPFAFLFLVFACTASYADEDPRQMVELPDMMQRHMMNNMRDHLAAINEILIHLGNDEMDLAAEIAEQRLGMSSLQSHGAGRMAGLMPEGMREAGTNMHRAASRFALKAQEGDLQPAYVGLSEITTACVACHAAYRIR